MSKYKFEVHTGDECYAGTDSNIFVRLVGVLRTSSEYRLNGLIKGNAFERNDRDKFTLDTNGDDSEEKLGPIYSILLRSDTKYGGSDWLLDSIKITSPKGQESLFKISEWITNKKVKTYMACNIPVDTKIQQKDKNIYGTALHYVPANASVTQEDVHVTKIGYHLSETKVKETSTNSEVSISGGDSIKAALKFAVATKNSKQENTELFQEVTDTCTQKIQFPVCDTPKCYRAVYIENTEEHTFQLGNLTLTVPATLSQKAGGFLEVKE